MYLHHEKENLLDWFPHRVPVNETLASEGTPKFLKSNYPRHRVVEFYAHWCPHCKRFRPKYIEFAYRLRNLIKELKLDLEIDIAAVSCVPHRKTCKKFKVNKYPTLRLFHAHSLNATILKSRDIEDPIKFLKRFGIKMDESITEMTNMKMPSAPENNFGWPLAWFSSFLKDHPPHFMDRSKQEIFRDAHLSLEFLIGDGAFMSLRSMDSPSKKRPLKTALKNFLEILSKTVPLSCSMKPLLRDLLQEYDKILTGEEAELLDVMKPHKLDIDWSQACTQHESGFTCGLWTLFHISSVGLVKWNQLNANNSDLILSSKKVADTLRDVIDYFFQCEVCSDHFLFEYDSCSYDRCNRFRFETERGSKMEEWREYPLWLYETHNGVNARLREERIEAKEDEDATPSEVLWPPENRCKSCWKSTERWNETEVYRWLCSQYWIENNQAKTTSTTKLFPRLGDQNLTQHSFMLSFTCIFVLVSGVVLLHRKQNFDRKGYHKKVRPL